MNLSADDIVYISGPMSGLPEFNKPAFIAMEYMLRMRYGCKVLNPARQPDGLDWTEYLRLDIDLLRNATALVALPGYERSRGATIEIDFACMSGIYPMEAPR